MNLAMGALHKLCPFPGPSNEIQMDTIDQLTIANNTFRRVMVAHDLP